MKHALALLAILVGCATTQTTTPQSTTPEFDKPIERAVHATVLVQTPEGQTFCSGTLIKRTRRILSAAHCFPRGRPFRLVGLHGTYLAEVVHLDEDNDIAILRPVGVDISLRDGVPLAKRVGRMGDKVWSLGHAQGDEFPFTLTDGIVSFPHRQEDNGHYVQSTAPLLPGMSGGGTFNADGELLGANLFVWLQEVHCLFPPCGYFQDSPLYGFSYLPIIKTALAAQGT